MAKRMVSSFSRRGFPSHQSIDDDGQAKPCVFGVPWVNPDTLRTLKRHGGVRTGPRGEAFDGVAPTDRKVDVGAKKPD